MSREALRGVCKWGCESATFGTYSGATRFFHHSLTTRSDNSKASRHEACSFNPFLTQPALLFKLKQHSAVVVGFLLLRVGSLKIRTATI